MIVGLTGGIATGKSTVAQRLKELGATVIDADQVSRDVASPGSETIIKIQSIFGDGVLNQNGTLNREALGVIVRRDKNARARLEAVTHPAIRAEIARRVQEAALAGAPAIFVEAALLVETGSASLYPDLWVVRCDSQTQIERLMARNNCDRTTAEEWVATQMPVDEKVKHATVIIHNDGDLASTLEQTNKAYAQFIEQQQGQD